MSRGVRRLFKWLTNLALAMVLSVLIDHFLFGFAVVKGGSMEPTIFGQDRLFIVKPAMLAGEVAPGDIVIFHPPRSKSQLFVKRVMARENDRFKIEEGIFYLNGRPLEEAYLDAEQYIERGYLFTEGVVPPGMVFVLGDNRNDSNDSRTFGFVSADQIRGKVLFKVWPLPEAKAFLSGY